MNIPSLIISSLRVQVLCLLPFVVLLLLYILREISVKSRKNSEEKSKIALKKAHKELALAMDSFEDIIYILDKDRCLVRANLAFFKLMGTTPEKTIGHHITEIVHPEGEIVPCPVCRAQEEKRDFKMIMEADEPNNPTGKPVEIIVKIIRTEDKTPHGILMNLHDLTHMRKAEQALLDSESRLQTLLNATTEIAFLIKADGTILTANKAMAEIVGKKRKNLIGKSVYELFNIKSPQKIMTKVQKIIHSNKPLEWKDAYKGQFFSNSVYPVFDDKEKVKQVAVFAKNITALKQAEEARQLGDQRLNAAIETIDEGFVLYDAQDRLVMCNDKYKQLYKESAKKIIPGTRFKDILWYGIQHGQYIEAIGKEELWADRRLALHYSGCSNFEQELSDGRWIKITERKIKDGSIVGSSVDITEIKASETKAREALKEKETLLREIHHRVKNNMQVISSLLSLQAAKLEDPKLVKCMDEAENRVHSMALVHEILYHSDTVATINFQTYLKNLAAHLANTFISQKIQIKINAEKINLSMGQAVPCGLIVTELITNALKYAFLENQKGIIKIDACYYKKNHLELRISDNGKGFSNGTNLQKYKTLGLRLVRELVQEQLEGALTLETDNGVCWIIKWQCT